MSMALRQTMYYFLDSEIVATYFLRVIYGLLARIVNMEVRGNLAKIVDDDDTIHFYSSLNCETGSLSRNRLR